MEVRPVHSNKHPRDTKWIGPCKVGECAPPPGVPGPAATHPGAALRGRGPIQGYGLMTAVNLPPAFAGPRTGLHVALAAPQECGKQHRCRADRATASLSPTDTPHKPWDGETVGVQRARPTSRARKQERGRRAGGPGAYHQGVIFRRHLRLHASRNRQGQWRESSKRSMPASAASAATSLRVNAASTERGASTRATGEVVKVHPAIQASR